MTIHVSNGSGDSKKGFFNWLRISSSGRPPKSPTPPEDRCVIPDGQQGISFDLLFGDYLRDAHHITITDPYIQSFYQMRNLMELLETVVRHRSNDKEICVRLVTRQSPDRHDYQAQQLNFLEQIEVAAKKVNIAFSWVLKDRSLHARHIVTDHGWEILLDRGLDIFHKYDMHDSFDFQNRVQSCRLTRRFEVTYRRSSIGESAWLGLAS